jgi:pimeloyl-ACP methyl ester carboxylesterase
MRGRLGPLTAEHSEAERTKFTAPLVLVHGLWDGPRSWRRFMGYLSHRGWRCIAVGWENAADRQSLAAGQRALAAALAELDEAPVVIGHDLGGLMTMRAAAQTRAAIALAPLVPGATSALERAGGWLQRLRGAARSPGALASHYPSARPTEPIELLRDLVDLGQREDLDDRTGNAAPRLIVAGDADKLSPPAAVRELASACGAELEVVSGGHRLHLDDGWEEHAAIVHRWLIRSLGEELLALYDEAWADRD